MESDHERANRLRREISALRTTLATRDAIIEDALPWLQLLTEAIIGDDDQLLERISSADFIELRKHIARIEALQTEVQDDAS